MLGPRFFFCEDSMTDIPGTEPDVSAALRRRAAAPLRPIVVQQACDLGLFSDEPLQLDLVDLARRK
jgi:hypothetical protein